MVDAAVAVVDAAGVPVEWLRHEASAPLGAELVEATVECGVALKGPVATPPGRRSPNLELRQALDLVVGVRPSQGPGIDVVVVRMLAQDLYAGREAPPGAVGLPPDAGVSLKYFTPDAVRRAARAAYTWALAAGRDHLTVVHKATVMPATDGLFLEVAREAAPAGLSVDDRLVDAVCHDLVTRSASLDVLFTGMLYGDLLSDLAAGLAGGLGRAPGANYGERCAVFEPVHGTALRRAGRGTVDPIAMIRTAAMLLAHLGESEAADRIETACRAVSHAGDTAATTAAVIERL